ncbi:hypothetical protein ACFVTT_38685 [Streptomyces niveus]|uniref:hypothetical protein n=1 Tax=Streptomyces niveus TaxID=193462 RepID=UPI00341F4897
MTTMTFTLQGRDRLSRVMDGAGDSAGKLSKALALVGSAIPAAAALGPLIAGTGAAAVAVAAYGVAIGPQVVAMGEAVEAEKKYQDAVETSGRGSAEAAEASIEYARQMAKLPPATQRAAASLMVFKDEYKDWSDALAEDTMGPFIKGLALAEAALPRLTPLVQGSSRELDRFMTIVGGTMATPGFDRVANKFADFAEGSLRKANDGLVSLLRAADGDVGRGLEQFLDYARSQGPLVGETFKSLGEAAINLLAAATDVGVGVLQLANAFAQVVASLPPGFLTVLMQAAIAVKAIGIAMAFVQLSAAGFAVVRTQIAAAGTAAIGASGAMGTLRAAFMAMSLAARTAVAATGIGLLILGLVKLSNIGREAPPNVDKLTSSMSQLGRTGKVSGEAARLFGDDLDGLYDSVRSLTDPSTADNVQQFLVGWTGWDSTPVKEAKERFDAIDESLAKMVQGGKADLAAAALKRLKAEYAAGGKDVSEFTSRLDGYEAALADAEFEAQLAADAQGLFGDAAMKAQAKLAASQASTDGLAQSINALSNAALMARGGIRGMEAAIDAASAAAKENGRTLDESTAKGRANNQAIDDLAAATMKAAESARANGASWATVNGIYDQGRAALVKNIMAMGKTETQAKKLAAQILKTPDKTARLRGNLEDLQAKLTTAKARLKSVPDSRKAKVKADIAQLNAQIAEAKRKLKGIPDETVSVMVQYRASHSSASAFAKSIGGYATGGLVGFPAGGPVRGPGTGTSDSILARLSNGEYVIPADKVSEYGQPLFDAIRNGKLGKAMPTTRSARSPYAGATAVRGGGRTSLTNINITVEGAVDPIGTARAIQKALLTLKRTHGININLGVG